MFENILSGNQFFSRLEFFFPSLDNTSKNKKILEIFKLLSAKLNIRPPN